jgi:uncharacterized protein (TIGR00266 family)
MSDTLLYAIEAAPDFPLLRVQLDAGQQVLAEPSAMATMSPHVQLKSGVKGGIGKGLGRMFGGESFIVNTFTAQGAPGEVALAAGGLGDLVHYRLNGAGGLMLQRGAFLAQSNGVEVSASWQGAKGFFSGQGLVMLKATGAGDLFFTAYGAILPMEVDGRLLVDTGYIVAFEDTLSYRITTVPGARPGTASKLKSFFFGGEALVCELTGKGKVWVQTRQVSAFLSWVYPFRPTKKG